MTPAQSIALDLVNALADLDTEILAEAERKAKGDLLNDEERPRVLRLLAGIREAVPRELLAEVHIPRFLPRGSKNIREHYMARKRRVEKERRLVTFALLAGAGHLRDKGDLVGRVEIMRNSVRLFDSDNCTGSLAATRDAVAEFLDVNDGDPRISWCTGQRKVKRDGVGVVIRIEARP